MQTRCRIGFALGVVVLGRENQPSAGIVAHLVDPVAHPQPVGFSGFHREQRGAVERDHAVDRFDLDATWSARGRLGTGAGGAFGAGLNSVVGGRDPARVGFAVGRGFRRFGALGGRGGFGRTCFLAHAGFHARGRIERGFGRGCFARIAGQKGERGECGHPRPSAKASVRCFTPPPVAGHVNGVEPTGHGRGFGGGEWVGGLAGLGWRCRT